MIGPIALLAAVALTAGPGQDGPRQDGPQDFTWGTSLEAASLEAGRAERPLLIVFR